MSLLFLFCDLQSVVWWSLNDRLVSLWVGPPQQPHLSVHMQLGAGARAVKRAPLVLGFDAAAAVKGQPITKNDH